MPLRERLDREPQRPSAFALTLLFILLIRIVLVGVNAPAPYRRSRAQGAGAEPTLEGAGRERGDAHRALRGRRRPPASSSAFVWIFILGALARRTLARGAHGARARVGAILESDWRDHERRADALVASMVAMRQRRPGFLAARRRLLAAQRSSCCCSATWWADYERLLELDQEAGEAAHSHHPTATSADIERLPTHTLAADDAARAGGKARSCAICLEAYAPGDRRARCRASTRRRRGVRRPVARAERRVSGV